MASKALDMLLDATKDSSEGFFIMIEGSRIDHAAHSNDAAAHFREIMEYQETVSLVLQFIEEHPDTVMVSVSDHECGGLTVGVNPDYLWYPAVLDPVTNSTTVISSWLVRYPTNSTSEEEISAYILQVLQENLGITDATSTELATVYSLVMSQNSTSEQQLTYSLSAMVNTRAKLGWTTWGHTGVDVNLYAQGTYARNLHGNVGDTEIGDFIVEALELDLASVDLSDVRSGKLPFLLLFCCFF